ncbi:hypothetical protein F383_05115 [Gossypium arboreum]|uniref:Uncharacterized protein n=1 Tax=Gossypium arboreum TaxID=29729 RepID=A0A0B0PJR8_GOSAR|nr:hypothetical protein F383_05115 [Gossypium arboreum]
MLHQSLSSQTYQIAQRAQQKILHREEVFCSKTQDIHGIDDSWFLLLFHTQNRVHCVIAFYVAR